MPARIKIDDPESIRLLHLLAEGYELHEAASEMAMGVRTTRDRAYAIKKEMRVSNNTAMVYQAVKRGII